MYYIFVYLLKKVFFTKKQYKNQCSNEVRLWWPAAYACVRTTDQLSPTRSERNKCHNNTTLRFCHFETRLRSAQFSHFLWKSSAVAQSFFDDLWVLHSNDCFGFAKLNGTYFFPRHISLAVYVHSTRYKLLLAKLFISDRFIIIRIQYFTRTLIGR